MHESGREAMDAPTIAVATNADLLPAAKALCDRFSRIRIIVCGDDDWQKDAASNICKLKALEAGIAVDGYVAFPIFKPAYYRKPDETSFFDLHAAEGIGVVRDCIDAAEPAVVRKEREERPANDALVEKVETAVHRLADLSETAFELSKKSEAKALGVGIPFLEQRVKEIRRNKAAAAAKEASYEPVQQWPHPVDGEALLDDLVRLIRSYVSMSDHAVTATALWILHSHAFASADVSPFLAITSPVKRCGKTTLLEIIEKLVPHPLCSSNLTKASIYIALDQLGQGQQYTFLIDEMDTFVGLRSELRGILNAGHRKTAAYVLRSVSEKGGRRLKRFSVWAAKAVALIGRLPDTLEDRSIVIRMQRKSVSKIVETFKDDCTAQFDMLNQQAARWAADSLDDLKKSEPEELREQLNNDRASNNWRHLFSIADLAGGDWPQKARASALAIGNSRASPSDAEQLLADCEIIFNKLCKPALSSAQIIEELCRLPESDWAHWKNNRKLTPKAFANILEAFNIGSKKGGPRGDHKLWYRSDFEPAWVSYLLE